MRRSGSAPGVPTELAAIVVRGRWHLGGAYRSAADLGRNLDRFLARVDHGAASTVHPEVAFGHDRSALGCLFGHPACAGDGRRAAGPRMLFGYRWPGSAVD
jgi:hypothetical protein